MNLSAISTKFMLGLVSAAFVIMLATAGLHLYAVYAMPQVGDVTPDMIPAPSAQRDQTASPEANLSDEQMVEISDLMGKLKDNPNDSATLTALGDAFLKAQDWVRAEFFLSKAVLSKPSDTRSRYMLAIALYQQNKIGLTIKAFEELLAIEEDPAIMYNLAIIYKYQVNEPKRAVELFNKIIALPGAAPEIVAKAQNELK